MIEQNENLKRQLEECSTAFRSSEARFRNIITRSADGMIVIDGSGTIRFVNPAAEALFGRKGDELIDELFGFPLAANETSELTIVSRKDSRAIIEMRIVETEWEGERAFLANLRDITAQKKTQVALRESEERYSAFVHATSQSLYRMSPDWSEMLWLRGGGGARFIPDTVKPNVNWLQLYTFPDDRTQVFETIERAVQAGTVFELEHRVRRIDGTVGWVFSRAVPLRNADGQIVEWFGAASDITQRKQMEEALKISEERLRFASTAADIGMWHWDMEKDELIWSERCKSLFGYPPEYPMTYKVFLRSVHEKDRQRIDEAVRTALQEKTDYLAEMRVVLSGDQTRWVLAKGRAFYDDQGKPVRMHGIVMDITGRKQMEADIRGLNADLAARATQLAAVNQELEAFNYTVAHDLRKPLTVINGYCQVITDVCGDMLDENCKGYLLEAYNGTVRMNRLIDDLLNFSGVGHAEPKRQQVNLSSLANQVASELQQAEMERRVTFRISDDISADTDPALLRIVLNNLFGNAWKYTGIREEGIIEFDTAEFDGRRAYFVRDNGIGFDPSDAGKLFEPFQRLENAKVAGGLGIGLATVVRVIKRLGGEVWAKGEPEKGATFYFTLPPHAP